MTDTAFSLCFTHGKPTNPTIARVLPGNRGVMLGGFAVQTRPPLGGNPTITLPVGFVVGLWSGSKIETRPERRREVPALMLLLAPAVGLVGFVCMHGEELVGGVQHVRA